MTDHPSTFKGDDNHRHGIEWDDRASLHRVDDGDGVLDAAKGLRSGCLLYTSPSPRDQRGSRMPSSA